MPDVEIAESSPATSAPAPSLEDRAFALSGKARDHYMLTGDVDAAEALMPKKDVPAESSPAPEAPETDEPEAAEAEAGTAQVELPKKKTQAENFAELRRKAIAAEARAELLERQLAESRGSAPAAEKVESKPVRVADGKPKLSQYTAQIGTTYQTFEEAQEAYDDARDEYRETQLLQRQSQQQQAQVWSESVEQAKARYPDFEAVAFSDSIPASDAMIHVMQSRKDGADLAYYLGKHPDVAKRLAERTAEDSERSIGRVEAELDRIAESLKQAVPVKTTVRPKPTLEVAVEPKGSAVDDEEADAISRGDTGAYIRIANRKAIERAKNG